MKRRAPGWLDASLQWRNVEGVDTRALAQELLDLLHVPLARCQHQQRVQVHCSCKLCAMRHAISVISIAGPYRCRWAHRRRKIPPPLFSLSIFCREVQAAPAAAADAVIAFACAAFAGRGAHNGQRRMCRILSGRCSRREGRRGRFCRRCACASCCLYVFAAAAQALCSACSQSSGQPRHCVLKSSARTCPA